MNSQNVLSIVIVNWNAGKLIADCVHSIFQSDLICEYDVIVVDNDSSDGSDFEVERISNVKLIRAGTNLGFAAACNLGAKNSISEYILFLNPDALVYPDTLSDSLMYMRSDSNTGVGVCGVQLKDRSGDIARSCARFPTLSNFIFHALGVDRFIPRLGYAMHDWSHNETKSVDHLIGAFYLIRRAAFDEVSGFDERYFMYLEDLDLSYKLKNAGWDLIYLATVQAFHVGGGTSSKVKSKRLFYSLRSRILYAAKNLAVPQAIIISLITLIIEPFIRVINVLIRGCYSSVPEIFQAYKELWLWLPRWILKGKTK